MTTHGALRWSTDLVTFFHPAHWGEPADLANDQWNELVVADPRPYFERMLDDAAEAGLDGVELAPHPGGWEQALRAFGSAEAFGDAVRARGLAVSGSYQLPTWLAESLAAEDDEREAVERSTRDLWARHAAFAAAVGCDYVMTSTVPRSEFPDGSALVDFERSADETLLARVASHLNEVGEIAAAEGVGLAIHSDAYSVCSRPVDIDRLMEATDPSHVHLCIDAGHIALDGGDPVAVLDKHASRSPILHWKDCVAPLPPLSLKGSPSQRHDVMVRWFRLAGTGIVDWDAWIHVMNDRGWSGWGVSEVDMSTDPIADIQAGMAFFRRLVAQTGGATP